MREDYNSYCRYSYNINHYLNEIDFNEDNLPSHLNFLFIKPLLKELLKDDGVRKNLLNISQETLDGVLLCNLVKNGVDINHSIKDDKRLLDVFLEKLQDDCENDDNNIIEFLLLSLVSGASFGSFNINSFNKLIKILPTKEKLKSCPKLLSQIEKLELNHQFYSEAIGSEENGFKGETNYMYNFKKKRL